jgi:hypothetical protein
VSHCSVEGWLRQVTSSPEGACGQQEDRYDGCGQGRELQMAGNSAPHLQKALEAHPEMCRGFGGALTGLF